MVVTVFNNVLCRGITVSDRLPGEDYQVYFFDWGNISAVPVASVDRPSEFWETAAQAVPCLIPDNLNEIERKLFCAKLSCFESSKTILDVEFLTGPVGATQIRDYVLSRNPEQFAYTLNLSSVLNHHK